MIVKTVIPSAVVMLFTVLCFDAVAAEIIDFESGFERLETVTSVATSNNTLNFSLSGGTTLFVANVGIPKDAFESVVEEGMIFDIPTDGEPGSFFTTYGPENPSDYQFDFEVPVGEFSVQLYDFRGDGGARPTDFVTLRAFSDSGRTDEVAMNQFVIPSPRPTDGAVLTLDVSAPSIAALTLEFSTNDRGTGIDNIRFVTIPEPSTSVLFIFGLLALLAHVRARRRT